MLINRGETEGAWIGFKKRNLEIMPVLDLEKLDTDSIKGLADTYDEICNEVLSPFPEMENDPIRMKIDDAVAKALGLPDFLVYRMMLVQEPMVCLRRLG